MKLENRKGYPLEQVLREADTLLVLVDHDEFKEIDRELLKEKVLIDKPGSFKLLSSFCPAYVGVGLWQKKRL